MSEQNKRTVYIGIIRNENFDSRTLVKAGSADEAMDMVLEKYKDSLGVYFQKEDVTIVPFSELFK